jgi:hypothetical protein
MALASAARPDEVGFHVKTEIRRVAGDWLNPGSGGLDIGANWVHPGFVSTILRRLYPPFKRLLYGLK